MSRPLAVMIGSSVASWAAITAAGGAAFNPELAFGMAAPLAGAALSWRAVERMHAAAPERVTSVLIAGLAAKMIFFGLYIGLLGALWLRPKPLVVAFGASFLALHMIEAVYLRKLTNAANS
jgi:hypothetical protein